MKKPWVLVFLLAMILFGTPRRVYASKDITFPLLQNYLLSQDEFKNLSEELGLALSYNMLGPANNLGWAGFEIGGSVSFAVISRNAPYWQKVTQDHNPPDYLFVPRLIVRKGLPLGIDLGVSYLKIPDTNISLVGGEVKLALLKDGVAEPAIGLRGAYSSLLGVDQLRMQVIDLSLAISKKVFILEPYAGISGVFIMSRPDKIPSSDTVLPAPPALPAPSSLVYLKEADISALKGTLGLQLDLTVARLAVEAAFAKIPVYSVKLTFGL